MSLWGNIRSKMSAGEGAAAGGSSEPRAAGSATAVAEAPSGPLFPSAVRGIGNADQPHPTDPTEREERIVQRVQGWVEAGRYELPMMPATTTLLLDLIARADVKLDEVAKVAARDPVLSSEMLRAANALTFAGARPAETVSQAVLRLGLRNVHAMALSLSLKQMVSRTQGIAPYAAEVWRQCTSMAILARIVGAEAGMDEERCYLVGLLHDVGKIPLLDLIHRALPQRTDLRRSLVGRTFSRLHERMGEEMARRWLLPDAVASVAGCHHDYGSNTVWPEGAALASLAHTTDLHLSLGQKDAYWDLRDRPEFEVLRVPQARRRPLLESCIRMYVVNAREAGDGRR